MSSPLLRRRELVALLCSGAAVAPLALRAQPSSMPVVGMLIGGSPQIDAFRVAAVREGLNTAGFVDGRNVAFEYRWAENRYERLPALAADLVGRQVTVIAAIGNAAAIAAKAATATVPVVFEI